ncbi:MAG: ATP-binding cassette domain-containing protein [Myxococcota bacterium]|nr:ATP-binding cassette domain-containing protein [Myxococcota bacterium]
MAAFETKGLVARHVGPVDFCLAAGDCVGLTGASGSGKSLLLRALADLDPHEGEVFLEGIAQGEISGPNWRSRVGYLPAESHWWAPRIGDHFSKEAFTDEVEQLGLPSDVFDWNPERMSSGEKQRLAFLRLLSVRPEVLLLDEPTANLDAAMGLVLERIVRQRRDEQGVSVIWVSHDLGQLERVAGEVLVLDGGSVL